MVTDPVRYVYVAGAPYCGSTLLSFLLNTHPDCVSVGESFGPTQRVVIDKYTCSCGELLLQCSFWQRLAKRVEELDKPFEIASRFWKTRFEVSTSRYVSSLAIRSLGSTVLDGLRDRCLAPFGRVRRKLDQAGTVNMVFARAAMELSSTRVFIDASKVAHRVPLLARVPEFDLRVIHLVRDARGGTASVMKNVGISNAAVATRSWRRRNSEVERARRFLPSDRWLLIRYGELCADPQAVMDGIADFIGVPHASLPEDFRSVEHHLIGNQMRLRGSGSIREDLSWRVFLAESDLDTIARISGAANRHFGYDWP